ncbi:MAG: type II toxin-antitoxin system HicA family toxin [Elusimicrobia bacterium]|nr:type II toxin-antitoxin system HicA family toxin [Candidatus Liberimonas magnetica]
MKRKELVYYLRIHSCVLLREGKRHSVFVNLNNDKVSTVPRHKEINDFLAKKICRDLEIKEL